MNPDRGLRMVTPQDVRFPVMIWAGNVGNLCFYEDRRVVIVAEQATCDGLVRGLGKWAVPKKPDWVAGPLSIWAPGMSLGGKQGGQWDTFQPNTS